MARFAHSRDQYCMPPHIIRRIRQEKKISSNWIGQ